MGGPPRSDLLGLVIVVGFVFGFLFVAGRLGGKPTKLKRNALQITSVEAQQQNVLQMWSYLVYQGPPIHDICNAFHVKLHG